MDRQLSLVKEQKEKLQQMSELLHGNNKELIESYERSKREHNEKYDVLSKKFSDALDDIRQKLDEQAQDRITLERERETLLLQVEVYKKQLELFTQQAEAEGKKSTLEKQLYQTKFDELIDTLTKKEKEVVVLKKKVEVANHERNIMSKQLNTSQSKMGEFTKTVQETKASFLQFQKRITQLEEENKLLRDKLKQSSPNQ